MAQLCYYTSQAVDHLRHEAAASLDWYYSPNGPPPADAVSAGIRESRLEAPALAEKLVMDERPPSETDADNALIAGLPKSNIAYWGPKLARTRVRDWEHVAELIADGWRVLTIWECRIRNTVEIYGCIRDFLDPQGVVSARVNSPKEES